MIDALGYGSGFGYDESGTEEPANSWAGGGIGGMSWKFSFSPPALRAFGALLKKRTFISNNIVDNHRTLRIG